SSPTRTYFIPERRSARELSFQRRAHSLDECISQTGSRAQRRNRQMRSRSLQQPLRQRIELETMEDKEIRIKEVATGLVISGFGLKVATEATDFVASEAAGEGMGRYTGGRLAPTNDEIAQLAYYFYELRGREDGYHIEDWLRAEQQLLHHYA